MVFRKIHRPAKRFSSIVVSGLNIERRGYAIGEDLECALQYSFKNLTTHCDHRKKDNRSIILFNSTPLLYSVERSSKLQITVRIRKDRFGILFFEERVDLIYIRAYTTRAWHLEFYSPDFLDSSFT